MRKTRTWLVMLCNHGKTLITVVDDGYVLDSCGRKLFVLKKEAIQLIRMVLENYQETGSIDSTSTHAVKYNGNRPFETISTELSNELLRIIYCSDNIKFPQPDLIEVLDLIQADLVAKEC